MACAFAAVEFPAFYLVTCLSAAAVAERGAVRWFLLLPLGCCLHSSDLGLGNYISEQSNLR